VSVAGNNNHIDTCVVGPVAAISGEQANTATISGTYNGTTIQDTSTARYATTGLALAKTSQESTFLTAGDILHYNFEVVNTESAPLPGPVTVDNDRTSNESCPAVSTVGDLDDYLDPGESLTCTATYTVTAGDVTAGAVTNTASATAGGVTSNTARRTVNRLIADLTVQKNNDVSGSVEHGGTFHWTIAVANNGARTASFADTQVILRDNLPGADGDYSQGPVTVINGSTAPGGTIDCSITGTVLTCTASSAVTSSSSASFSIKFTVTASQAGMLSNTATVDPDNHVAKGNEINNTGTNSVTVLNPTFTPTSTSTGTPTDTPTDTPTSTAKSTPIDTPTDTPTPTSTIAATDAPTNTPTQLATDTPTNIPTASATNPPTDTPTLTATATETLANTPTPTASPTSAPKLFDPPFGLKTFDDTGLPLLQWTTVWINNSNTTAIHSLVSDGISAGTAYGASGSSRGGRFLPAHRRVPPTLAFPVRTVLCSR
jgi:hypothetical protein